MADTSPNLADFNLASVGVKKAGDCVVTVCRDNRDPRLDEGRGDCLLRGSRLHTGQHAECDDPWKCEEGQAGEGGVSGTEIDS